MIMKTMVLQVLTYATTLLCCSLATSTASTAELNPYMGAPVTLVEAPNGAIANKKILDGVDKVAWLEPTIEQPVAGVQVSRIEQQNHASTKFQGNTYGYRGK